MKSNFCFMWEFLNKATSVFNFFKDNWKTIVTAIFSLISPAITARFMPILQTFGYFHAYCISLILINCAVFSICAVIWIVKKVTTVMSIKKEEKSAAIEINKQNQIEQNTARNNITEYVMKHQVNEVLNNNTLTEEEKNKKLNEIREASKSNIIKQYEPSKNYFCGTKDLSDEKMENFIGLFNRYMNSFVSEEVRKLLAKAMKQADEISKDAVLFLIKLTEEDLSILKKQFKYVSFDIGIFFYTNITEYMDAEGLFNKQYSMKFYNQIWCHERNATFGRMYKSNFSIQDEARLIIPQFFKNYNLSIKTTKKNITEPKLQYFNLLTDIGIEIYDLLKDDIEDVPEDYLNKFLKGIKTEHPRLDFEFERTTTSS